MRITGFVTPSRRFARMVKRADGFLQKPQDTKSSAGEYDDATHRGGSARRLPHLAALFGWCAGEVDLSHLAGRGVFAAWDDRTFFEAVRLEDHGAVAWGEELELCPDALYMQLVGKSVAEVMPGVRIPVENA